MTKIALSLVLAVALLLLIPQTGECQRHTSQSFYEQHDTAFVRAAGVVLLGLSESAIKQVWASARTAEDSENANTALDDYSWYLSSSIERLQKMYVPNYVTGCRYVTVIQGRKQITFDRRAFTDSSGIEAFDALVSDDRSVYKFLTEFQMGNEPAIADVKRILHLE